MVQVTKVHQQSGFQSIVRQRTAMQNWSHLNKLLFHGSNREAIAIVQSFESHLSLMEECSSLNHLNLVCKLAESAQNSFADLVL